MAAERGEMEEERKRGMRDQGRAEEGLPRKREGRLRAGLAGGARGTAALRVPQGCTRLLCGETALGKTMAPKSHPHPEQAGWGGDLGRSTLPAGDSTPQFTQP